MIAVGEFVWPQASGMLGVSLATMDANIRRRATAINFGIIYGIGAFGLGQQIGVPQAGGGLYRRLFRAFPSDPRTKTDCRRTGYVETIFGRKCFIPGIRDANPMRQAGAERQGSTLRCRARPPISSSARWAAFRRHSGRAKSPHAVAGP
jgi:DNA polymerase I-like protein with 3'-5' exonuclease and polymerase domains